jgi:fibronectin type 3 domain-containing protein
MLKALCVYSISLGMIDAASAQQSTIVAPIAVLARSAKDSILLRWAPSTAAAWQLLNKNGYLVRRYTLLKEGKLLDKPETVLLTPQPLKPLPLAAWEPLVEKEDRYGSIAAQALYGDEFAITQQIRVDMGSLINKLQEAESRFSFALFSADQSFTVAQMMGLGYVDKTARKDEKYVYRIYPALADKRTPIDTGFAYIGLIDSTPLPKPYDVQLLAQDKGVLVSWNQEAFAGVYTTYGVERSADGGKSYVAVNEAPVVNTAPDEEKESRRATFLDTVSAINRRLVYRVKGISPFGEVGPASDTVSVTAVHALTVVPSITGTEVIENKQVVLNWELPQTPATVVGFDVERSQHPQQGYQKINKATLPATTFTVIDRQPLGGNYYRIKVYGQKEATYSFPVFVQLVDSLPPAAPGQLAGAINKEGLVSLHWPQSSEPDLYGYRVYRANSPDEEFVQVSRQPIRDTIFTDTIEAKTLAKRIYYKLVALDNHFNPSAFSKQLELKRPDVVLPAPPSFTEVVATTAGVYLAWNRSSSDDVRQHELYRTEAGREEWSRIAHFTDTVSRYTDASAAATTTYTYKVRAVDEGGLTTESKPFNGKKLDLGIKPAVSAFKATVDRAGEQIVLRWTYKEEGVASYLLYRAEPGKPMRLYKTLEANTTSFTDTHLFINTLYQYRLKAVFADGEESAFSKVVEVNY